MIRKIITVKDAALEWIREFNSYPIHMINTLIKADPFSWQEIQFGVTPHALFALSFLSKSACVIGRLIVLSATRSHLLSTPQTSFRKSSRRQALSYRLPPFCSVPPPKIREPLILLSFMVCPPILTS